MIWADHDPADALPTNREQETSGPAPLLWVLEGCCSCGTAFGPGVLAGIRRHVGDRAVCPACYVEPLRPGYLDRVLTERRRQAEAVGGTTCPCVARPLGEDEPEARVSCEYCGGTGRLR